MKHRLCRPPADAVAACRLTPRGWIRDDGKPGLAFSWLSPTQAPMAGATECDCVARSCPKRKAMDYTSSRFGAANGTDLKPLTR